ncbi:MAG: FkbM family methyltransferase, partial [Actinomycetota bacterium]|nr:FkbM family methyltransferase [Actinomycetota bacterium]
IVLSALAQFVVNRIPRHTQRWKRLLTLLALRGARRLGDPLITYEVGAGRLWMPLSHDLPLHRSAYPQYSSNLVRVAASVAAHSEDFVVIDVGANVGDSLALVRDVGEFAILCIEPEPSYFWCLQANARQFKNVEVLQLALADGTTEQSTALSSNRGTASIDRAAGGSVPLTTLDEVIELRPAFAQARLVKVDTDGSDLSVIRGGASFLRKVRPVLFFEYDPAFFLWEEAEETVALLARMGYRTMLFWDNTGDFLVRLTTDDVEKLRDLTSYYGGRASSRYCDVAVFAADDEAVSDAIRDAELALAEERRRRSEREDPNR